MAVKGQAFYTDREGAESVGERIHTQLGHGAT